MAMDSSKIISLDDFAKQLNRYPSEEEALQWALQICELIDSKDGNYPLLSPRNVYIENGDRWVTAHPPVMSDSSEALFRAGVILYYLLARTPFEISHYLDSVPSIRERNPQISVRLESIVLRLLQNIRALRYLSIQEFREDLQRLQMELSGDWTVHWECFKGNAARANVSKYAIDPAGKTLKEIWKAAIGEIWASPIMAGENLFVGSADGNFYSLDSSTGKVIWQLNTGGRIESTACIDEHIAYLGNDLGNFFAVNIKNGTILWKKSLGEYIRSSACCDSDLVYVGSINPSRKSGVLWALAKGNGATVWKKTIGPIFASPAVDQDEIYIGSDDEVLYCLGSDGNEKWKMNLDGKIRSTAVVTKDFVYAGGFAGVLYKIRRSTGVTAWRNEGAGSMYSSPACGRGFVVIGNNAGQIRSFQLNGGKLKGEFATGGPVTASPLIVGAYTLVGSNDGKFYILDAQGVEVCAFDAKAPINSSAYYYDNTIFVGSDQGLLALSF